MHSKDADLISNICGFYEMFKNRSFGCALDASFHDNYLWSVECVRSRIAEVFDHFKDYASSF